MTLSACYVIRSVVLTRCSLKIVLLLRLAVWMDAGVRMRSAFRISVI